MRGDQHNFKSEKAYKQVGTDSANLRKWILSHPWRKLRRNLIYKNAKVSGSGNFGHRIKKQAENKRIFLNLLKKNNNNNIYKPLCISRNCLSHTEGFVSRRGQRISGLGNTKQGWVQGSVLKTRRLSEIPRTHCWNPQASSTNWVPKMLAARITPSKQDTGGFFSG